jgi:hypothetical protein
MQHRAKNTLFHVSQLLAIVIIIASGMPVKAAGMADNQLDPATQNSALKSIGLPQNPGILAG